MDLILEQLRREMGASLSGLDAAQTQLRSQGDAERWSIQQIVEHLLLTYASTCDSFKTRIAKGTPTKTRPTILQWAIQCAVLRAGYFPTGVKAPVFTMPPKPTLCWSGERLMERVIPELERMDKLAAEVERLLGRGRAMSHGVLGPLCVAQWRRFHLVHGEHHLKQIRAIRAANGL